MILNNWSALVAAILLPVSSGFSRRPKQCRRPPRPATGLAATTTATASRGSLVHLLSSASFDFSAPSEWEAFYKEHPDEVMEWHSSVPLERLASHVPHKEASVLMVGCGNSRLAATILANCQNSKIVLLDTSQTCLDQLKGVYGNSVEYVCGNAIQLDRCFESSSEGHKNDDEPRKFDIIIDKGLSDALFCSEGWNGPIEELYRSAATVLKPNGKYLLISYKLPSSTQSFLSEVGQQVQLKWEFDIPEDSNNRVGVSLATKMG
jgi:SAM-dependent methyltransferase